MQSCSLCACVLLATLACTATAMRGGDVFTSSGNIFKLFSVEKDIGTALSDVIAAKEAELQRLRIVATQLSSAQAPPSDIDMTPSTSFGVLKRVVDSVKAIDDVFGEQALAPVRELISQPILPSAADLNGAAKAMLRLQRTYNLKPGDLFPEGSVGELTLVAKEAYSQDDMFLAEGWFKAALAQANCTEDPSECHDLLDHLAYAQYKLGDVEGAHNSSVALLALDPNNGRVMDNIEYYKLQLSVLRNETSAEALAAIVPPKKKRRPHYDADNHLRRDEKDLHAFRRLCQGRKLRNMTQPATPLKCYLRNFGKAHLMYNPVRVEVMNHGASQLSVIRDFATQKECDHIREVGDARLKRAVAWNNGKFQPVEFRTSTAGWVDPDTDEVIARIHRRMADATQLDLEYAEQLQVSNYGLGGSYETHYDHSKHTEREVRDGDRLATFMIYLSPVRAGGFTAFPRLGAAVQPSQGDAAVWFNLLPSGDSDDSTLHGGCPVLEGSKWVANKWIHERNNVCRRPAHGTPASAAELEAADAAQQQAERLAEQADRLSQQ